MAPAISPLTLQPDGVLLAGQITLDLGGSISGPVVYNWYVNRPGAPSLLLQSGAASTFDTLSPSAVQQGIGPGSSVRVEASFSQLLDTTTSAVVAASDALSLPLPPGSLVDVRIVDTAANGLLLEGTRLQAVIPNGLVNPSFQWYRIAANAAIPEIVPGATSAFLDVGNLDAGVRYAVDVSYDEAGSRRTVSAPAVTIAQADNGVGVLQLPASWADENGNFGLGEGVPVNAATGLDAVPVLADPDGNPAIVDYRWIDANNPDPATNVVATGPNYQPGPQDAGRLLRLQATYEDLQGNAPVVIQSEPFVIRARDNGIGQLSAITGSPTVGNVLQAGRVSGDPDTPSQLFNTAIGYQWFKILPGSPNIQIAGATASSYVPTTSDLGSQLVVQVRNQDAQGFVSVIESAPTLVARPDQGQGQLSGILGSPRVGSVLTAGTVRLDPDGDSNNPAYTYQWQKSVDFGFSWSDLVGQVNSTYTSDPLDVGAQLRVAVSYADALGHRSSLTSAPMTVVDAVGPAANLSVVAQTPLSPGALSETDTLLVGLPQGFNAQFYQWYRNGLPISGATQSSFATTTTSAGQYSVQAYGFTATGPALLASPVSVVQRIDNGIAALTIASQAQAPYAVGDILQASLGVDLDGAPAAPVVYTWERRDTADAAWVPIAGVTGTTYTVVDADAGAELRIRANYVDAQGFVSESLSATQQVAAPVTPPIVTPPPTPTPTPTPAPSPAPSPSPSVSPSPALRPVEPQPVAPDPVTNLPLLAQVEFGIIKRGVQGANDEVIGTDAGEVLGNGLGVKRLIGKRSSDAFLFDRAPIFSSTDVDTIVDFTSGEDFVFVSKKGFPDLERISFKAVYNKKALSKEAAKGKRNFLYRIDTGALYYDANRAGSGFGAGGQFAAFEGKPFLRSGDIRIAPETLLP